MRSYVAVQGLLLVSHVLQTLLVTGGYNDNQDISSTELLEENSSSSPKAGGADVTLLVENLIFDSPLPDALPVFKARHATFICCFVEARQLSY